MTEAAPETPTETPTVPVEPTPDETALDRARRLREEERRLSALADYSSHLATVRELKRMTDTKAWQELVRWITNQIDGHAKAVLDAEKPREVVQHQEGVKILRSFLEKAEQPVNALNEFIHATPLFSGEMKVRAEWNPTLGRVELRDI